MAQSKTVNPYFSLGQQLITGLNSIISSLPPTPSEDDLVNAVWSYIQPIYFLNQTNFEIEVKSVSYNCINSYRNNLILSRLGVYNELQMQFVNMMIGSDVTSNIQPNEMNGILEEIEDNIGISLLTIREQQPLFLSSIFGATSMVYWKNEVNNPQSAWSGFFSSNSGENYLNTMVWSVAAMNGALAGYGSSLNSLIEPTINVVTNLLVSSLVGALTVSAGKLIFNWTPRLVKPLMGSIGTNMNDMNSAGALNPVLPPKTAGRRVILYGDQVMGSAGPSGVAGTGNYGYDSYLGGFIKTKSYFLQTDTTDE